jgi:vancomycin permeability regulator SanA
MYYKFSSNLSLEKKKNPLTRKIIKAVMLVAIPLVLVFLIMLVINQSLIGSVERYIYPLNTVALTSGAVMSVALTGTDREYAERAGIPSVISPPSDMPIRQSLLWTLNYVGDDAVVVAILSRDYSVHRRVYLARQAGLRAVGAVIPNDAPYGRTSSVLSEFLLRVRAVVLKY